MNNIGRISLIILFLAVSGIINGQNEENDALFLKVTKEYTLNKDGSVDYRYSKQLKLFTHYSFHRRYGETFIVYDPEYQNLRINEAFTTMADGKKIITPDNAFNEVLPRFATDVPRFNHFREMVVTHTGLECNAVINLDYQITSKKDYLPAQLGDELLQHTSPIKELVVIIKVPLGKTLFYRLFDGKTEVEPEVKNEDGFVTYTWTLYNLPTVSFDLHHPNNYTYGANLSFSMVDKETLFANFMAMYKNTQGVTLGMKEKLIDVADEEAGKLNNALKIQQMVVNELKLHNVSLQYAKFNARSTADVWQSNWATEFEKAILLKCLLIESGINAHVIATIKPTLDANGNYTNLKHIRNFYVGITADKVKDLYLSVNNLNARDLKYDYAGNHYLAFGKDKIEFKQFPVEKKENIIEFKGAINIINNKELQAGITVLLTNSLNNYLEFVKNKKYSSQILSGGLRSSEIGKTDYKKFFPQKSQISYELKKKNPFEAKANYLFWNVPEVLGGVTGWHMTELALNRSSDIQLPTTINESYEFSITLPDNMVMANDEVRIEERNNIGEVIIIITKAGNRVNITRKIVIKYSIIPLNHYPDFRKLMNLWNNNRYSELVFKTI